MKKLFWVLILLLYSWDGKSQETLIDIENNIVGVWVSVEDPLYSIEFMTDGFVYDHYEGTSSDKFSYTITHSCENEKDENSWFLKKVSLEDGDEYCYYILGVSKEGKDLSLMYMPRGNILVFTRK